MMLHELIRIRLSIYFMYEESQEELNKTFCLSNISPQVGNGFNRDYWARFEKFVRDLTKVKERTLCLRLWLQMSMTV